MVGKIYTRLRNELSMFHARLYFFSILQAIFPIYLGNSIRPLILRWIGFQIGMRTQVFGMPRILGPQQIEKRLEIGQGCLISYKCTFDLAGRIRISDSVNVGPECMLLTGTHTIGPAQNRLGDLISQDIFIGRGVWMGARCTILPGVTIGPGVILGAGSIVNQDLPANTLCAGVPARVIRELDLETSPTPVE